MEPFHKLLKKLKDFEAYEARKIYKKTKERLKATFPKGRFRANDDGSCVLVSLKAKHKNDFVFVYGPEKFGLFTDHCAALWMGRLKDFLTDPENPNSSNCGGERILHFRDEPTLCGVLPEFQRYPTNHVFNLRPI